MPAPPPVLPPVLPPLLPPLAAPRARRARDRVGAPAAPVGHRLACQAEATLPAAQLGTLRVTGTGASPSADLGADPGAGAA